VVVVVVPTLDVWLFSSAVSRASADCNDNSAEETDSLKAVVSSEASVSPTVT
jgi:hypothetical protein